MTWPVVFLIVAVVLILSLAAVIVLAIQAVAKDQGPARDLYRKRQRGANHGD